MPGAPNTRNDQVTSYSAISPEAAAYMREHNLVMRNTHHQQAQDKHHIPTHKDLSYAVPLFTVPKDQADDGHQKYIEQIKRFIWLWAPFAPPKTTYEYPIYDYELVIAVAPNKGVYDEHNEEDYPTGGKTNLAISQDNMVFSLYLNDAEIAFLKDVLMGKHDERFLPPDTPIKREGAIENIRILLCRQLSAEIITAKLIRSLNAQAQATKPLPLDRVDLNILLKRSIEIRQNHIGLNVNGFAKLNPLIEQMDSFSSARKTVDTKTLSYAEYNGSACAADDSLDDEVATVWEAEPAPQPSPAAATPPPNRGLGEISETTLANEFFAKLYLLQDESWSYWLFNWLFHNSHWDNPTNDRSLDAILNHALNDTTFFGYRNRSFEACVKAGWINNNGQLTDTGRETDLVNQAFIQATN